MKFLTKLILNATLLLAMFGCAINSSGATKELEENFEIGAPVIDLNDSLQLRLDSKGNKFPADSKIPIYLYNKSNYTITVDDSSRIKLLLGNNNEWIEVENSLTYSGVMLLAQSGTPLLDTHYTWVQPAIDNNLVDVSQKNALIRIVVIGEITENNILTGKLVGAYIDVIITK